MAVKFIYRNAINGQTTTKEAALADPDHHVREQVRATPLKGGWTQADPCPVCGVRLVDQSLRLYHPPSVMPGNEMADFAQVVDGWSYSMKMCPLSCLYVSNIDRWNGEDTDAAR